MDQSIVDALDMREWAMAERFDDFARHVLPQTASQSVDVIQTSFRSLSGRVAWVRFCFPRYSSALTYRWRAVICATPSECLCW